LEENKFSTIINYCKIQIEFFTIFIALFPYQNFYGKLKAGLMKNTMIFLYSQSKQNIYKLKI